MVRLQSLDSSSDPLPSSKVERRYRARFLGAWPNFGDGPPRRGLHDGRSEGPRQLGQETGYDPRTQPWRHCPSPLDRRRTTRSSPSPTRPSSGPGWWPPLNSRLTSKATQSANRSILPSSTPPWCSHQPFSQRAPRLRLTLSSPGRQITSRLHLLTAISQSLLAQSDNNLKTKTVHSEVLFYLEPTPKVTRKSSSGGPSRRPLRDRACRRTCATATDLPRACPLVSRCPTRSSTLACPRQRRRSCSFTLLCLRTPAGPRRTRSCPGWRPSSRARSSLSTCSARCLAGPQTTRPSGR